MLRAEGPTLKVTVISRHVTILKIAEITHNFEVGAALVGAVVGNPAEVGWFFELAELSLGFFKCIHHVIAWAAGNL